MGVMARNYAYVMVLFFLVIALVYAFYELPTGFATEEKTLLYLSLFALVGVLFLGGSKVMFR
jgi:hypothetical protein